MAQTLSIPRISENSEFLAALHRPALLTADALVQSLSSRFSSHGDGENQIRFVGSRFGGMKSIRDLLLKTEFDPSRTSGSPLSRYALYGNPERGLPFGDGVFDRVAALFLMEESMTPRRIFREAVRILKRRGSLVAVLLTLTGEDPAHYAFQRRAGSCGFHFPFATELTRILEQVPLQEMTLEICPSSPALDAVRHEIRDLLGLDSAPLQAALISGMRLD